MNLTSFAIDGLTLYGIWVDLLQEKKGKTVMTNGYNNEVMNIILGETENHFL